MNKKIYVTFVDIRLETKFESLKDGKFSDKQLYKNIDEAIQNLKKNPSSGTKIPKKVWPKKYIQEFKITNLWKYDLPQGWRLIYTIKTDEIMILDVILEWFSHKEYERRFKY